MSKAGTYGSVTVGAAASVSALVLHYTGVSVNPAVIVAAPLVVGAVDHGVVLVEKVLAQYRGRVHKVSAQKQAALDAQRAQAQRALVAAVKEALPEAVAALRAEDPKAAPAVEAAVRDAVTVVNGEIVRP